MIFTQLQQINTAHSLSGETLFLIIEKHMVFLKNGSETAAAADDSIFMPH